MSVFGYRDVCVCVVVASCEPVCRDATVAVDAGDSAADFNDVKKSNWGDVEDDPIVSVDSKQQQPATTAGGAGGEQQQPMMTLEEWRALHPRDRCVQLPQDGRKANDGEDVFSGMEEYRKGRFVEEQGDEHDIHDNQHGRQKQSIPVSIRFSRNSEYGDSSSFDAHQATVAGSAGGNASDFRGYPGYGGGGGGGGRGGGGGSGGGSGGGGGGGYYRGDGGRFRGSGNSDGAVTGGRGRARGGADFSTYGRGRDFNRGGGGGRGCGSAGLGGAAARFNRNAASSFLGTRKDDAAAADGVNINLGNEDEFPTLS